MAFSGTEGGNKKGWAVRLLEHINSRFPQGGHRIDNAARDGTPVRAFSNCLFSHLSADVHLVVAEWGSMGNHNHQQLTHIEQVATTLLALPARPVLLHLSIQEWCTQKVSPRQFYRVGDELIGRTTSGFVYPDTPWARVDLECSRVCGHYQQPCISVKEALEPHVLNGEPGFGLSDLTGDDCLHPINGRHGVAYLSAMLAHWFDHAHALWQRTRLQGHRWRLPPPLHMENRLASGDNAARCYAFEEAPDRALSRACVASHGARRRWAMGQSQQRGDRRRVVRLHLSVAAPLAAALRRATLPCLPKRAGMRTICIRRS